MRPVRTERTLVYQGLSASAAAPFVSGLHAALPVMAAASILGFFSSVFRGSERDAYTEESGL